MLQDKNASAMIAVKNLDRARAFYEGTLGLRPEASGHPEVLSYRSGKADIAVYQSQYAGTNRATALTWGVGPDIERVVTDLKSKGVAFEHYDMPDAARQGDLHVFGNMKVAWFKDPDGNILSVINE